MRTLGETEQGKIKRALNQSTFTLIAQVDGDENFYKDDYLVAGTKYSYRLRLVD